MGAVEVRQFFRRLNEDPEAREFPEVDDEAFLARLGRLARKINDAGILYRDLSMGNVLAVQTGDDLDLYLVDFNRARIGREPGVWRRTRDICRLPVLRPEHRAAFLEGYWGAVPSRHSFRWWFYALSVDGYILKHAIKKRLKFLRLKRRHAHGGSHHPHIPAASEVHLHVTRRFGTTSRTNPTSTPAAARSSEFASPTAQHTCETLALSQLRPQRSAADTASSKQPFTSIRAP